MRDMWSSCSSSQSAGCMFTDREFFLKGKHVNARILVDGKIMSSSLPWFVAVVVVVVVPCCCRLCCCRRPLVVAVVAVAAVAAVSLSPLSSCLFFFLSRKKQKHRSSFCMWLRTVAWNVSGSFGTLLRHTLGESAPLEMMIVTQKLFVQHCFRLWQLIVKTMTCTLSFHHCFSMFAVTVPAIQSEAMPGLHTGTHCG